MNIYSFIESPEVAEYMRKRRPFTPTEMVSIIANSSASIETQMAAYEEMLAQEERQTRGNPHL